MLGNANFQRAIELLCEFDPTQEFTPDNPGVQLIAALRRTSVPTVVDRCNAIRRAEATTQQENSLFD